MKAKFTNIGIESRTRFVKVLVWALMALVILAFLPAGVAAVWSPKCDSCHDVYPGATARSSHASLDCMECHGAGNMRYAFNRRVMYEMYLGLGRAKYNVGAEVNQACITCHKSVAQSGVTTTNGINFSHKDCASQLECASCHEHSAHIIQGKWTSTYSMDQCLACHAKEGVVTTGDRCAKCHNGEHHGPDVAHSSVFQTTHGKNWKKSHGAGDLNTCELCHEPAKCAKCHGVGVPHTKGFYQSHGSVALSDDEPCLTCHDQADFCDACHKIEMPHPSNFTKAHTKIAEGDKDPACITCHAQSDCDSCHSAHVHPGGAQL